jgi:hypothetical protein
MKENEKSLWRATVLSDGWSAVLRRACRDTRTLEDSPEFSATKPGERLQSEKAEDAESA